MANDKPERRLERTNVDTKAFVDTMREHELTLEHMFRDIAIALGDVVGHEKIAAALVRRINDMDAPRTRPASRMLSAVWQAVAHIDAPRR
ncbi:MAG: hypothetical protein KF788_08730 [Piscinibacter sp.]|nr:hypothetical protein [Piscinibacter sp.]